MTYMTTIAFLIAAGIYAKVAIGFENQRHERIKNRISDAARRRIRRL